MIPPLLTFAPRYSQGVDSPLRYIDFCLQNPPPPFSNFPPWNRFFTRGGGVFLVFHAIFCRRQVLKTQQGAKTSCVQVAERPDALCKADPSFFSRDREEPQRQEPSFPGCCSLPFAPGIRPRRSYPSWVPPLLVCNWNGCVDHHILASPMG